VTEQLPLARVHAVLLKLPVLELENVTVPVGVEEPAPEVSVTVAVQLVAWPAVTEAGVQLTDVLVFRLLTVSPKVPLLVLCVVLPP